MPPESKSGMLLTEEEIFKALGWAGPRSTAMAEVAVEDARRIEAAVLRKWARNFCQQISGDHAMEREMLEAAAEAEAQAND